MAILEAQRQIGMPSSIHAQIRGHGAAFQRSLSNQPILILAALATVYIVLGMLYESYIHPITILSTLPSAGVGALLALLITRTDLSRHRRDRNHSADRHREEECIMMIDFALDAERREGKNPQEAIYQACLLRFRPIMMTTMAALLGGLPLAIGMGTGSELRRPLGITIVGGLIVSQMLGAVHHSGHSISTWIGSAGRQRNATARIPLDVAETRRSRLGRRLQKRAGCLSAWCPISAPVSRCGSS